MRWKLTAVSLVFVAAATAAFSGRWPWHRLEPVPAPPAPPLVIETRDTLRHGETLSELFARHGLAVDVERYAAVLDPRRLRAGLEFSVRRRITDSLPSEVSVRTGPEQRVFLRLASTGGWQASTQTIGWTVEPMRVEGTIETSLYDALGAVMDPSVSGADGSVRLAWDLADVFQWQVDFGRDLQPGDRFRVVVEHMISEEGDVRLGRVLASDLTVSGRALTAFRFDEGAKERFYDSEGKSLRRAFLRAPLQFRRISSRFSSSRRHPVLGIMRRHEGTDYAAAPGTPVRAAGDGTVLRAGWAGGYGRMVEVRHRNGITTRYGHLRGFGAGIRAGARVAQGDVVGYVGSSGLANGPHLHYEFRVNGAARDPRRIDDKAGEPVPAAARQVFLLERDRLALLLAAPSAHSVAAAKGDA